MQDFYPHAEYRPTARLASLGTRPDTWAVALHETYGLPADEYLAGKSSAGGDEGVFMHTYPVHLYVLRDGSVRQYAPLSRVTFHAYDPANELCVSVEHEGRNDVPWTAPQLAASARLFAWLADGYALPLRHAAHPVAGVKNSWAGFLSHYGLTRAHIGGAQQTHTDTVPSDLRWRGFLRAVKEATAELHNQQHAAGPLQPETPEAGTWPPPHGRTLRLVLPENPHSPFVGWSACAGPLLWIAHHGLKPGATALLSWNRSKWQGAHDVTGVARHLSRAYLGFK